MTYGETNANWEARLERARHPATCGNDSNHEVVVVDGHQFCPTCGWSTSDVGRQLAESRAEVERLRARTHEIQEAADARNASLHSQVERHKQLCREAHDWLGDYRARQGVAWESVYEQFGVVNLVAELGQARDEIERLRRDHDAMEALRTFGPRQVLQSWGDGRWTYWRMSDRERVTGDPADAILGVESVRGE